MFWLQNHLDEHSDGVNKVITYKELSRQPDRIASSLLALKSPFTKLQPFSGLPLWWRFSRLEQSRLTLWLRPPAWLSWSRTAGLQRYAGAVPVGREPASECFYILNNKQCLQPLGLSSDAGHLKENGTLVLKGRLCGDTEVKPNGIRIGLKDVEQTVLKASQGQLAHTTACVRSNLSASGDDEQAALKYMVAYCIFSSERVLGESYDAELTIQRILETLPLPRSMRPSILFPVDDLPRTSAGKLDRRTPEDLQIPTDH
ncbi:hypothetical protein CNMCM7927_009731 [Aspergillus lentulus]|nr:hypothetical protein CNMCM7927_009731 [Aspergillus lentulus]